MQEAAEPQDDSAQDASEKDVWGVMRERRRVSSLKLKRGETGPEAKDAVPT